jgi:hypothetical protein
MRDESVVGIVTGTFQWKKSSFLELGIYVTL